MATEPGLSGRVEWMKKLSELAGHLANLQFAGTLSVAIIAAVVSYLKQWPWPAILAMTTMATFCGIGATRAVKKYWETDRWTVSFRVAGFSFLGILLAWGIMWKFEIPMPVFQKQPLPSGLTSEEFRKKYGYAGVADATGVFKAESPGDSNLIWNGDFKIPLSSRVAGWGNGQYTDIVKIMTADLDIRWSNFLSADTNVLIEATDRGNALKIIHTSETMPNRLGVIEQYIDVKKTGTYELSFYIKAEELERGALLFVTTKDWKRGPRDGGYILDQHGTFGWVQIKKKISLKTRGMTTFTIASIARGTAYISDLSLLRIP